MFFVTLLTNNALSVAIFLLRVPLKRSHPVRNPFAHHWNNRVKLPYQSLGDLNLSDINWSTGVALGSALSAGLQHHPTR